MKWTALDNTVYGWAIQTKLKDVTLPCSPFLWHADSDKNFNNDFDTPTEMLFGFGKKIVDTFPHVKQTLINVHCAGASLPWHIDTYLGDHWKIHFPIESNNKNFFQYEGEEFVLTPGNVYLVNTSVNHATDNRGKTERAHLIFKVPVRSISDILSKQYEI
jgi:hypothetical protein